MVSSSGVAPSKRPATSCGSRTRARRGARAAHARSARDRRRQADHEASAALGPLHATDAPVVALDDLAHQRQAQADAAGAFRVARQAEERLEDALAEGLG